MCTRSSLTLLLLLLVPGAARADAPEPPPKPIVYLALDPPAWKEKRSLLKQALRAALPAARGFSGVAVSAGCRSGSRYIISPVYKARETASILPLLEADSCSAPTAVAIVTPTATEAAAGVRRHIVALAARSQTVGTWTSAGRMVTKQGFTLSLISLTKIEAKDRQEIEKAGAGRVRVAATAAALAAALRAELGWLKLSKAQETALRTAAAAKSPSAGVLAVLGSVRGGGAVTNVLSGGGSGGALAGRVSSGHVYKNPKLRRAECLIGARVAVTFRRVSCTGACDIAEARRRLLAEARSLLPCLERQLTLGDRDEVSVEIDSKGQATSGSTPAAGCVSSWYGKVRHKLSLSAATVFIGPAGAVQ